MVVRLPTIAVQHAGGNSRQAVGEGVGDGGRRAARRQQRVCSIWGVKVKRAVREGRRRQPLQGEVDTLADGGGAPAEGLHGNQAAGTGGDERGGGWGRQEGSQHRRKRPATPS